MRLKCQGFALASFNVRNTYLHKIGFGEDYANIVGDLCTMFGFGIVS